MDAQEQKMLEMMQEILASQAESLRLLTEQIAEKDRINKALEQRVAELSAQLAWFQRQMFGRKSEKMPLMDPNQMSLFAPRPFFYFDTKEGYRSGSPCFVFSVGML